jgi:hypothetical protein
MAHSSTTNHLLNSLFDIASNIQIESNFRICHPNYQPFAIPTKVADRFKRNLPALQFKYLTLLLRNFIYGIYYNGSLQKTLAVNSEPINSQPHQNLEQNSTWEIDRGFYEQLHNSNHGIGYYDSSWRVARLEPDGSMAVTKGGLTFHIEPNCHLKTSKKSIHVDECVAIWMPKNRLKTGSYLAVSNIGQEWQSTPNADLGVGRIYFNFTPSGAVALMDGLTLELNSAKIPFTFQVLYNPCAYGRYDAGVLYFESHDYPAIRTILQAIYSENQRYFQPEVPLFTKVLAPGLGLAEEPTTKFTPEESFGMNRCQIVANALLEAWQVGKNAVEERMRTIEQHFALHFINVQRPYLNSSSVDIYYPLNLRF